MPDPTAHAAPVPGGLPADPLAAALRMCDLVEENPNGWGGPAVLGFARGLRATMTDRAAPVPGEVADRLRAAGEAMMQAYDAYVRALLRGSGAEAEFDALRAAAEAWSEAADPAVSVAPAAGGEAGRQLVADHPIIETALHELYESMGCQDPTGRFEAAFRALGQWHEHGEEDCCDGSCPAWRPGECPVCGEHHDAPTPAAAPSREGGRDG